MSAFIRSTHDLLEVRALTWKEPFATLMFLGKVETRKWNTPYRGWVAIHAAKIPYSDKELLQMCGEKQFERIKQLIAGIEMYHGNIIGLAKLTHTHCMKTEDEDACFLQYNPDLVCHVYSKVSKIKPIPFQGQQGWAKLNQKFIRQNIPIKLYKKLSNSPQLQIFAKN